MLRSLIHLDLSFVHVIWVYFHSSTCWYPVMPVPLVKYVFFFPFDVFCFFVKIRCSKMCGLISGVFYLVWLVLLSVLMPIRFLYLKFTMYTYLFFKQKCKVITNLKNLCGASSRELTLHKSWRSPWSYVIGCVGGILGFRSTARLKPVLWARGTLRRH